MDRRSLTSAENGRKGGRKKGQATLLAEKAREFIAQELEKNLKPIVLKAIAGAKQGKKDDRDWLSNRAWGREVQAFKLEDQDGNAVPLQVINITSIDEGAQS